MKANIFIIIVLLLSVAVSAQPWQQGETRGSLTKWFDASTATIASTVEATNVYRVSLGRLPANWFITELPIIYVTTAFNGSVSDSLCIGSSDDINYLTTHEALAASTGLLTADWNSTNYSAGAVNGTAKDLFIYYISAATGKATLGKVLVSVQYSVAKSGRQ